MCLTVEFPNDGPSMAQVEEQVGSFIKQLVGDEGRDMAVDENGGKLWMKVGHDMMKKYEKMFANGL